MYDDLCAVELIEQFRAKVALHGGLLSHANAIHRETSPTAIGNTQPRAAWHFLNVAVP
ncbi:hypothetical protein [Paraburkholderia sp. BL17N1]|uniref:hypothetical protein n=1 Tax=Paraburkholderia sp. BL17N1 TaxID=1938798 RepID=UPI0013157588|nr:hypothetical protein [Paraburkholderia sp. BL17N1]